jgi:hypothetical protein
MGPAQMRVGQPRPPSVRAGDSSLSRSSTTSHQAFRGSPLSVSVSLTSRLSLEPRSPLGGLLHPPSDSPRPFSYWGWGQNQCMF